MNMVNLNREVQRLTVDLQNFTAEPWEHQVACSQHCCFQRFTHKTVFCPEF